MPDDFWDQYRTKPTQYDDLFDKYGREEGVDPDLLRAMTQQESTFNPRAVSGKGASGLMQLMPATAERFGVKDIFNPGQNIRGGTKYMRWLLDRYNGDISLALAGYNAGEGAVDKYGRKIPPYRETQDYVKRITSNYKGPGYLKASAPSSFWDVYQSDAQPQPYNVFGEDQTPQTKPVAGIPPAVPGPTNPRETFLSTAPSALAPEDPETTKAGLLQTRKQASEELQRAKIPARRNILLGKMKKIDNELLIVEQKIRAAKNAQKGGQYGETKKTEAEAAPVLIPQAPTTFIKRQLKPGDSYYKFETGEAPFEGGQYLGMSDGKYYAKDADGETYSLELQGDKGSWKPLNPYPRSLKFNDGTVLTRKEGSRYTDKDSEEYDVEITEKGFQSKPINPFPRSLQLADEGKTVLTRTDEKDGSAIRYKDDKGVSYLYDLSKPEKEQITRELTPKEKEQQDKFIQHSVKELGVIGQAAKRGELNIRDQYEQWRKEKSLPDNQESITKFNAERRQNPAAMRQATTTRATKAASGETPTYEFVRKREFVMPGHIGQAPTRFAYDPDNQEGLRKGEYRVTYADGTNYVLNPELETFADEAGQQVVKEIEIPLPARGSMAIPVARRMAAGTIADALENEYPIPKQDIIDYFDYYRFSDWETKQDLPDERFFQSANADPLTGLSKSTEKFHLTQLDINRMLAFSKEREKVRQQEAVEEANNLAELRDQKRAELTHPDYNPFAGMSTTTQSKAGGMEPKTEAQIERELRSYIDSVIAKYGSATNRKAVLRQEELQEAARKNEIANMPWSEYIGRSAYEPILNTTKAAISIGVSGTLRGIALGAKQLDKSGIVPKLLPADYETRDVKDYATYKLADTIDGFLNYALPTNKAMQGEFWQGKLPQGIGSTLGMAVGGLSKTPRLALAVLSSLQMGGDAYKEAIDGGAIEADAQLYGLMSAPLGVTEIVGMGTILVRLNKGTGSTLWKKLYREALYAGGKEVPEEVTQEGFQTAAQNLAARVTFDPDRKTDKDLYDNMLIAGISAPLASGGVSILNVLRNRAAIKKQIEQEQANGVIIRSFGEGELYVFNQKVRVTPELKPMVDRYNNSRNGIREIQMQISALEEAARSQKTLSERKPFIFAIWDLKRELNTLQTRQVQISKDIAEAAGVSIPDTTIGESVTGETEGETVETVETRVVEPESVKEVLKPQGETPVKTEAKPLTVTDKDGKTYEVQEDRGKQILVQEIKPGGEKGSITLKPERKFTGLEEYRKGVKTDEEKSLSQPAASVVDEPLVQDKQDKEPLIQPGAGNTIADLTRRQREAEQVTGQGAQPGIAEQVVESNKMFQKETPEGEGVSKEPVAPVAAPETPEKPDINEPKQEIKERPPIKAQGIKLTPREGAEQAETPAKPAPLSNTQLQFSKEQSAPIEKFRKEVIDKADVASGDDLPSYAKDGLNIDPHVTVKYGLHTNDVNDIGDLFEGEGPIEIELGKTSVFASSAERGNYDVVIAEVKSPQLHALNKKISDNAEVTDTHPEYVPHITIAYVKKGTGKKYAGRTDLEGTKYTFDGVTFSPADKSGKKQIPVGKKKAGEIIVGRPQPTITDSRDEPVNPIDHTLPQKEKIKQLQALTEENKPIVEALLIKFREMGLTHANQPGENNEKKFDEILSKANRPEIKAKSPWFDVEHVRDAFRFRAGLNTFGDFVQMAKIIKDAGVEFVKVDTGKFLEPGKWGWRPVAFDLRMPNGQLVEFYTSFGEMIDAQYSTGEGHPVSNHKLFEKWRTATAEELEANREEYNTDMADSNRIYQAAYEAGLERAGFDVSDDAAIRASFTKAASSLRSLIETKSSSISYAEGIPTDQTPSADLRIGGTSGSPENVTNAEESERPLPVIKTPSEGSVTQKEGEKSSLDKKAGVEQNIASETAKRKSRPSREQRERIDNIIREARGPKSQPIEGSETTIEIPDSGKSYKARFVVRELDDIHPSHNPTTFQPNPDYYFVNDRHYDREKQYQTQVIERSKPENFKPSLVINDSPTVETGTPVIDSEGNVLGGNSRAMIIERVYDNEDARKAYQLLLTQKVSQFGMDAGVLLNFDKPMLVRELLDSNFEPQTAITDLNKTSTTDLTAKEKSIAEAKNISEEAVDFITQQIETAGDDASLIDALNTKGVDIVNRLIDDGIFGKGERNSLIDDGKITDDGKKRIERLLMGKVFTDLDQLELVAPSIKNTITRIISPLMKVNADPEWNILEPVREAIDLLNEAKAVGMGNDLDTYAGNMNFLRPQGWTDEAVGIGKVLASGMRKATAAFKQYADAMRASRSGEGAMFDMGAKSQPDAFEEVFGVRPESKESLPESFAPPTLKKAFDTEEELSPEEQLTAEEMRDLPFVEMDELLDGGAKATLINSNRVKLNAKAHEIIRRTLEQMRFLQAAKQGKSLRLSDYEDLFEGVFQKPETVREVISTLRDKAEEAKGFHYEPGEVRVFTDIANILEDAAKATPAGTVIPYVFERALPEELFHEADYLGAAEKTILNRHSDTAKKALDSHQITSILWQKHFSKFNEYRRLKSTPFLKATIRAEIAPYLLKLSDEGLAELGITPEQADDYMLTWFEGYAEKNGIESLANFEKEELNVQNFIERVKESHAKRDVGGLQKAGTGPVKQKAEPSGQAEGGAKPAPAKQKPASALLGSGQDIGRDAKDFFEPDRTQKLRSLPATMRKAGLDAIDLAYEVFHDKAAIEEATRLLEENGIEGSVNLLRNLKAEAQDAEHAILSFMLIRTLQDHAISTRAANPEAAQRAFQLSLDLGREHAVKATQAGRFTRIPSVIGPSLANLQYAVQGIVEEKFGKDKTLSPEMWERFEAAGRELETALAKVQALNKEKRNLQAKVRRLEDEKQGKRKKRRSNLKSRARLVQLVRDEKQKTVDAIRARLKERFNAEEPAITLTAVTEPAALKSVLDDDTDFPIDDFAEVGALMLTEGIAGDTEYLPLHFKAEMLAEFGDGIEPYFEEIYKRSWDLRNKWLAEVSKTEKYEQIRGKYGEDLSDEDVEEILGEQRDRAARRRAIEKYHQVAVHGKSKRANLDDLRRIITNIAPNDNAAIGAMMHAENLTPAEIHAQMAKYGITDAKEQREALREGKVVFEKAKRERQIERDRAANELLDVADELRTIDDLRWKARNEMQQARNAVAAEMRRLKSGEVMYRAGQIVDITNAMRTMMASLDLSGAFRQGGFFMFAKPELQREALVNMFKSITEKGYGRAMMELEAMPTFTLSQRAGIDYAVAGRSDDHSLMGEELFRGEQTIEKIPGLGPLLAELVVKPSERTYSAVLDTQRAVMFDFFAKELIADGLSFQRNANEFKKVAEFVNIATGRGIAPTHKLAQLLLDLPFFAPRYTLSRLQLLNMTLNPVAYYNMPPAARKIVAKSAVRFYGTTVGALGLISMFGAAIGASVDWDDDSDDFLKVKIGNTRYDIFAGLAQPAKMIIKIVHSAIRTKLGFDNRIHGEFGKDVTYAVGRFLRGKLSPIVGLGVDIGFQKDYIGNRVETKEEIAWATAKRFMPLTVSDITEAYKLDGAVGIAKSTPFAIFGIGVATYKGRPEKPRTEAEKLASKMVLWGMKDKGGQTADEKRKREVVQDLTARTRNGEATDEAINAALAAGDITDDQKRNILRARTQTLLESKASRLSLKEENPEFLEVWKVADAEERKLLKPYFDEKMKNLDVEGDLSPEWRKKLEAAGGRVLGDFEMPEAVRAEFKKFKIKTPDVGETLKPIRSGEKVTLSPEEYERYRSGSLKEIYTGVQELIQSDDYKQANAADREKWIRQEIAKGRSRQQKQTKGDLREKMPE